MRRQLVSELGCVAGVDEVGRGPLAGPVTAAAVILDPLQPIPGLRDSKRLSEQRRIALAEEIKSHAIAYQIAHASVSEIDEINILHASMLAMQRAIEQLPQTPCLALIDGNRAPTVGCDTVTVIKGDDRIDCISAASILAKVCRDQLMVELDEVWPGYGFAQHKGYGTKVHMKALDALGPCRVHRRSFAPVRERLSGHPGQAQPKQARVVTVAESNR